MAKKQTLRTRAYQLIEKAYLELSQYDKNTVVVTPSQYENDDPVIRKAPKYTTRTGGSTYVVIEIMPGGELLVAGLDHLKGETTKVTTNQLDIFNALLLHEIVIDAK